MTIKTVSFIEKKMKIIELFLAEKLACIPIKEIPKRCSTVKYPDREVWMIDGKEILEVSIVITAEGNPSFKFNAFHFSEFDYKLLADIVKEVFDEITI